MREVALSSAEMVQILDLLADVSVDSMDEHGDHHMSRHQAELAIKAAFDLADIKLIEEAKDRD